MKVFFSRKAELGLEKIFDHVVQSFSQAQAQLVRDELVSAILKIGEFPELGLRIASQSDKRILFVAGNAVIYEIVLQAEPIIVIRNVRPRGSNASI